MRRSIARSIRATKLIAGDRRIPKPLRWLTRIALVPIPGFKIVLIVVALLLFVFYREPMRDAWQRSFHESKR